MPLATNERMISIPYIGETLQAQIEKGEPCIYSYKLWKLFPLFFKYHQNQSTCTATWFYRATNVQVIQIKFE